MDALRSRSSARAGSALMVPKDSSSSLHAQPTLEPAPPPPVAIERRGPIPAGTIGVFSTRASHSRFSVSSLGSHHSGADRATTELETGGPSLSARTATASPTPNVAAADGRQEEMDSLMPDALVRLRDEAQQVSLTQYLMLFSVLSAFFCLFLLSHDVSLPSPTSRPCARTWPRGPSQPTFEAVRTTLMT